MKRERGKKVRTKEGLIPLDQSINLKLKNKDLMFGFSFADIEYKKPLWKIEIGEGGMFSFFSQFRTTITIKAPLATHRD